MMKWLWLQHDVLKAWNKHRNPKSFDTKIPKLLIDSKLESPIAEIPLTHCYLRYAVAMAHRSTSWPPLPVGSGGSVVWWNPPPRWWRWCSTFQSWGQHVLLQRWWWWYCLGSRLVAVSWGWSCIGLEKLLPNPSNKQYSSVDRTRWLRIPVGSHGTLRSLRAHRLCMRPSSCSTSVDEILGPLVHWMSRIPGFRVRVEPSSVGVGWGSQ